MTPSDQFAALPADHVQRMQRARLCLDGLSIGDSFGERFFVDRQQLEAMLRTRTLPEVPWHYTDDTAMAISIVMVLDQCGGIDQDTLARRFAERYAQQPWRGYGATAHRILKEVGQGRAWRDAASRAFGGQGSRGNGGAMRVAPVGAYFADDLDAAAWHARASAAVTHAHPDGQAGAIAVAVAAARACQLGDAVRAEDRRFLLQAAVDGTPDGPTREGLKRAVDLSLDAPVEAAAQLLGNGSRVIASDTVPFSLWCAARHLDCFEAAMWATVSGRGDRDTTCAIVGAIVSLAVGRDRLPTPWLQAREPLAW